jgi:inner membrane transporter RhtA
VSDSTETAPRWQQAAARFGNRIPAPAILVVALIIIQFSSGAAKMIMTADNAIGLVLFRLVLGTAVLWIVVRPDIGSLDKGKWTDVLILGAAYAFFIVAAYNALVHLPLGLVATIGFLGPLAISLVGSRRAIDFVWPVMGFVGVYLLSPSNPGAELSWSSAAYGLAYAASWAIYILASARAARSMRGLDGFVIAGLIGAILLLPLGYNTVGQFVSSTEVLTMAVVVTVSITVAFGLEFIVLKRVEPRVFGVLLSLEPAVASLVGMAMLHEYLSTRSWIAVAIVMVAASGAALIKRS